MAVSLSDAVEVVRLLRSCSEEVSWEAVAAIQAEVPEYVRAQDPRYEKLLFQTVAWSNARFLDLLEDEGASLDALLAFFREVGAGEAREGRGQELWQKAFRIGTGVSVRRFAEAAQRHPDVSATAVAEVVQSVLGYQNQIMAAMLEGHRAALGEAEATLEAHRRRLVELLLSPEPEAEAEAEAKALPGSAASAGTGTGARAGAGLSDDRLREAAADARWPLPRTVAVVAVQRRPGDGRPAIPADALSGLHRPEPCLIVGDPDGPGRRTVLETGLRDWIAAIGPPCEVTDAARSLRWARRTLGLIRDGHIDGSAPVHTLDHIPLLMLTRDEDLAQHLMARRLAPLEAVRDRRRRQLAETLLACLESDFSAAEIAVRLSLHPQTVRYRMRQLDALFGPDLRAPEARLETLLAVRYWLTAHRDD